MSAFSVFQEIAQVSAWTGLSAGLIIGLGILAWSVSFIRGLAIAGIVTVACSYGSGLYFLHVGRADVQAAWDKADAAAAAEAERRDATTDSALSAKYQPQIAALTKQSADLQAQVQDYAKQLLASKSAGTSCQLGPSALQLRHRQ